MMRLVVQQLTTQLEDGDARKLLPQKAPSRERNRIPASMMIHGSVKATTRTMTKMTTTATSHSGPVGSIRLAGRGTAHGMRTILRSRSTGTSRGGTRNKDIAPLVSRSAAGGTSMAREKAPGSHQDEMRVHIAARSVALDVAEDPNPGPLRHEMSAPLTAGGAVIQSSNRRNGSGGLPEVNLRARQHPSVLVHPVQSRSTTGGTIGDLTMIKIQARCLLPHDEIADHGAVPEAAVGYPNPSSQLRPPARSSKETPPVGCTTVVSLRKAATRTVAIADQSRFATAEVVVHATLVEVGVAAMYSNWQLAQRCLGICRRIGTLYAQNTSSPLKNKTNPAVLSLL